MTHYTSTEQMLEVNYQYIWKPSGRNLPDAAVVGAQLALTF